MAFSAKVILDSINPQRTRRLTAVVATYPRFIHSEVMTHRAFARNAASSRAIPWKKFKKNTPVELLNIEFEAENLSHKTYVDWMVPNCMYRMVMEDPVIPLSFDMEQKGMQSGEALDDQRQEQARRIWLRARDEAVMKADYLAGLGVHKSIVNRIVEPWMWITTLISATEWNNFFRLRVHPAAEKHFQKIAGMIKKAIQESEPQVLTIGEWHLPLIDQDDWYSIKKLLNEPNYQLPSNIGQNWKYDAVQLELAKMISSGRCARLSYLTHDGKRDIKEDIRLCQQLINPPSAGLDDNVIHASPLEHVAECMDHDNHRSGPFFGFKQYRKAFANENTQGSLNPDQ